MLRKLKVSDERTQRWHKQMMRYTMVLDSKNQYCQKDCTTQSNLQIPCNPYEITNSIFHRIRTKILQFVWKKKKDPK